MTDSSTDTPTWGLPNWRNEDEYPGEDAPTELWRWQFIRRRKDYREDWHKYKNETYASCVDRYKGRDVLTPAHPEFMCEIPGSFEKYGLKRCPNPSLDRPSRFGFTVPDKMDFFESFLGNEHTYLDNEFQEVTLPIPPLCAWIPFNISRPIDEQIKNVRSTLESLQREMTRRFGAKPESRRQRRDKWKIYLRVLDAREDGQTLKTIANEVLAPKNLVNDEQVAHNVLNQARALMENFPR